MNISENPSVRSKALESHEKLSLFPVIFIFLTVIATSLLLPIMLCGKSRAAFSVSIVICLLCSVILFISAKKLSKAVLLILLMAFSASFVGSPILPALIFGGIISIGCGAALICSAKKWQFLVFALIFPIAYALSFLLTGSLIISLLSLFLIFPVSALGLSHRFGAKKTTSLVICAAAVIIPVAGLIILALISTYGQLNRGTVDLIAEGITATMISSMEEMTEYLGQVEITETFKKDIAVAVDSYINMSVGTLIALALTASYAAHALQCNLFYSFGLDKFLDKKRTALSVSVEAAIIFIVAHVLSFATDSFGNTSLWAVVGGNLSLILFPVFLLTGLETIKALPKKLGLVGLVIMILIIILIFAMFSQFPIILALVGSFFVIFKNVDLWAKEHYGKGENK